MPLQYHVLTGPTAAGKSGLLLERASARPLAVVSADSRQVYRLLDIGTGKPGPAELAVLPHYGVDFLELGTKFSVYRYLIMLAGWLRELEGQGREVWVCGGTGLYIHALLQRLELGAPPRPQLRLRLAELVARDGCAHWATRLELQLADPHNPARLMRAAEELCRDPQSAARLGGLLGLELAAAGAQDDADYASAVEYLARWECGGIAVLDPGHAELQELIARRVRSMFDMGLPEEVAAIRSAGYGSVDEVANGIAYREAGQLLDGLAGYEEAVERSIIRTRQYAKRQRTYFRGRGWEFMDAAQLRAWLARIS